MIWATLYLESWKRRSAELAYQWGTGDQKAEMLTEPRPLFKVCRVCSCAIRNFILDIILIKGEERISEVTGKPELFYPDWKRNAFRYLVTAPVVTVCLCVVFATVFLILELQVRICLNKSTFESVRIWHGFRHFPILTLFIESLHSFPAMVGRGHSEPRLFRFPEVSAQNPAGRGDPNAGRGLQQNCSLAEWHG